MKKLLVLFALAGMTFGYTACDSPQEETTEETVEDTEEAADEVEDEY